MTEIYLFTRVIPMYRPGYYGSPYFHGFALSDSGVLLAKVVENNESNAVKQLGGTPDSPAESLLPYETVFPNGYILSYIKQEEQGSNYGFVLAVERYKQAHSGGGGSLDPDARYLVTEDSNLLTLED